MKARIVFLLCMLPFFAMAQVKDKNAPKYLEGAVTEVYGKVVFTTKFTVKQLDEATLYQTLKSWADERFKPQKTEFKSRILVASSDKKQFAAAGDEYLVFSSSFLALDRAEIFYHFIAKVEGQQVYLTMQRIKYKYEVERGNRDYIYAEDWITDKQALNKKKTKLYPAPGKFRRKTIDLKDALFASVKKVLADKALTKVVSPNDLVTEDQSKTVPMSTMTPATKTEKSTTIVSKGTSLAGYKAIAIEQLPQEIKEQLSNRLLRITAVYEGQVISMEAKWQGIDAMFGRSVATCILSCKTMVYPWMEKTTTYTLSFNINATKGAPVYQVLSTGKQAIQAADYIIECKKVSHKRLEGAQPQALFMGEIKAIWMKKK